jgi:catechol 2,3-dioxygenase-like lactoylglutathione lyase family enzyme
MRWRDCALIKSANVTIMVSDLKRAIHFYVDTLGLTLQYEVPGHWAQVEAPGLTIGLHPAGEHGPRPGTSGSLSIGFEVQDLETAMETLQSQGIVFASVLDDKATRIAHFSDPDGHTLYLVEVKPEAWSSAEGAEK